MLRVFAIAACCASAFACNAYDRTAYEALLDASACGTAPIANDPCQSIPPLDHEPVIDGTLECGLGLFTMPMISWSGDAPIPNVTTRVAFAYRPTGLYFYVQVDKGPGLYPPPHDLGLLYCGDAIELFVDSDGQLANGPAYDEPGTRQFLVAAPVDAQHPSTYGGLRSPGPVTFWFTPAILAVARPDGWALEGMISARDMAVTSWNLAAASHIGLDVAVDLGQPDPVDGGSCGRRLGQYVMREASIPTSSGRRGPAVNAFALCSTTLSR